MPFISLGIVFIYLVVMILVRKEPISDDFSFEKKDIWIRPFVRPAAWLYRKEAVRLTNHLVHRDISELYPSMQQEFVKQYYVRKLSRVMAVVIIGSVLAGVVTLLQEEVLLNGNRIVRGDYKEKSKEIPFTVGIDTFPKKDITMEVSGKIPNKEEVDELESEFFRELCQKALGNNPSQDCVYESLHLAKNLDGYPFSVEWESDSPHIADLEGNVKKLARDETCQVNFTVIITLNEWIWQHQWIVTVVCPPQTEEEKLYYELEQFVIGLEKNSKNAAEIILPEEWQGKPVTWIVKHENTDLFLWILASAAGVAIYFMQDKDLHTQVLKRRQKLREEYPVFVNKLALYIGAGLTIRGALLQIAQDYQAVKQQDGFIRPVYEENLRVCRELQTGMEETEVYERFGKRCGIAEYARLSTLLSQNLRKGSNSLVRRLTQEAENVDREQLNRSRKMGEEVSTKLLIPMVMMLGIVMLMIIIPAFGSFS